MRIEQSHVASKQKVVPTVATRDPKNDRRTSAELTNEKPVDVETRVASRDPRSRPCDRASNSHISSVQAFD